ncbi:MAG: ribonucrease [Abditibacteriota bacterium]|jgi:ribonuclease Y|nr:ribonucrease [Abditibacteriota bacterium]
MNPYIWSAIAGLLGVALGCFAMVSMLKSKTEEASRATSEARQISEQADSKVEARLRELQLESREQVQSEVAKLRETIEKETAERRAELKENERRLREKESNLDRRLRSLDQKEKSLGQREEDIDKRLLDVQTLIAQQNKELERVAALPQHEAREILLQRVAEETRGEMVHVARRIEDEAREDAEMRARKIIALAIQRCAVDQTAETAVSVVPLPSDELKGRIIGREGRNIRTFEQLSGCDLIIDDTPEAVVISSFEPVRREIARIALMNLVSDGRIHPARIEDMLNKAKTEIQQKMREAAERATADANVRLSKPMLEIFGRLLYRTSYGQNILKHSVEVATIAASIAAELGADVQVAKRAGLLHDLGKALDHDQEGTHVDLGMEVMRRHKESEAVITAAGEHHLDVASMSSIESVIVQLADAISSSRPGARRENVETYIKRLQNLEKIADSFNGVEKSYAIQAGREVRIVVRPDQVDDTNSLKMAREVAQRIQEEMTYPGEIKVTVIREMRSVDYAR